MTFEGFDRDAGSLIANARAFRYDAGLDQLADLRDSDFPAYMQRLGNVAGALSLVESYADLRDSYRRAVSAGVIPDDRGPSAA